ncbi:MAG: T9SS type A sorting domain-containing protein, partial [Cyclobacteriaceae bacterium]
FTVGAGTYTYTVTDANGCQTTTSITVTEPSELVLEVSGVADSCNIGPDGSVNVNVTGGKAPYSYVWSTGATTASVFNLSKGTYSVTVTDALGCQAVKSVSIGGCTSVEGNPALCDGGFRYEGDIPSIVLVKNGVTVTIIKTGPYSFDFTSTSPITQIVVKASTFANVYEFPSPGAFSGSDMRSPINPSTGRPYAISHVDFCFGNPTSQSALYQKVAHDNTTQYQFSFGEANLEIGYAPNPSDLEFIITNQDVEPMNIIVYNEVGRVMNKAIDLAPGSEVRYGVDYPVGVYILDASTRSGKRRKLKLIRF